MKRGTHLPLNAFKIFIAKILISLLLKVSDKILIPIDTIVKNFSAMIADFSFTVLAREFQKENT